MGASREGGAAAGSSANEKPASAAGSSKVEMRRLARLPEEEGAPPGGDGTSETNVLHHEKNRTRDSGRTNDGKAPIPFDEDQGLAGGASTGFPSLYRTTRTSPDAPRTRTRPV